MEKNDTLKKLIAIFDLNRVLFDNESKYNYGKDRTQHYSPNPLAVVFPENSHNAGNDVKTLLELLPHLANNKIQKKIIQNYVIV